MRSKLALATLLAVALVAPAALPCGAPFGNGINVDPKQDIIVVHKNGSETYVFQPRFCGNAQEFGLVLPIPAKLSAQPALSKAGVFSYVSDLSQPTYRTVTYCAGRGVGGSTGSAAGTGGSSGAVVVSSGTVGFMDYSQLETGSVTSLTAWLDANGYPYDSLAQSAFQYYVDKGWYFVAFKVNQGAGTGGSTGTCKDLGPVKLSFPTADPVVPTRMAGARNKDTSGVLSYSTGFSWHVYGITAGAQQVGFASGATSSRVLNYSGLLTSADVASLDGLAAAGDRLDKLTLTFSYGSTDPDVALADTSGSDYREVIVQTVYVECNDAGADTAVVDPPPDAPVDVARIADVQFPSEGPRTPDAAVLPDTAVVPVDASFPIDFPVVRSDGGRDVVVINPPPPEAPFDAAVARPDAAADAGAAPAKSDAAVATADAAPVPATKHDGCSLGGGASGGGLVPLVLAGVLIAMVRRRRR